MKLYFNGCSLTFGHELTNPEKNAYPVHVASELNSEFLNDAVPGGTNQRTAYKTIQEIDNFDVFFIAWTSYARFTEYNPVDNFEINFNPSLNLNPRLHYSNDLKVNYSKYKNYGELYYKYWYNELYEFKKWLQEIIMLQSLLELQNKKYMMLNTMENNLSSWLQPENRFIDSIKDLIDFFDYLDDSQLLKEHYKIQKLVSLINKNTFLEWNDWCITQLCSSYPCGPGGHLLEDGHKKIAEKVINFYKKL